MSSAWDNGVWGHGDWGQQANATVTVTGLSLTSAKGSVVATATIGSGWGRDSWSSRAWGVAYTLQLDSLPTTLTAGTLTAEGDALVSPTPVTMTAAVGTAVGEPEHVIFPTGVSMTSALSGVLEIGEGTGAVLGSLSMTFTAGDETGSGTVDAGWGRNNYGSFAWNENIEFITSVTGVSMVSSLGTTSQSVGTGVIVTPTGLSMTSSRGTLEVSQATALITPTGATFNTQLSGATVSGAGGTGVVAPSDQLDFAIGSSTIEIFTQVDPTSVQSTFDTGSVAVTGDAPSVDVTGTAITSALGSSTIEVGSGVNVQVTALTSLSFVQGEEVIGANAVVEPTGVDLTIISGNPYATPWANVVTGASNTWIEVDAA